MLKRISILCLILCLPLMAFSAEFVAGKDYEIVKGAKASKSKQVVVTEFFSYECPWCFRLEPVLEKWLKTKPKDVDFQRVPVAFNQQTKAYAKAYYVAKALKVSEKVNMPLFNSIHKERRDLSNQKALAEFFIEQGVKKQDFDNAYNYSMSIDAEMGKDLALLKTYKIYGIPAIVVAGKYKTDSRMSKGQADRMLDVVDFLIKKARQESKQ